jgi:cephalosporin hydroxylase
MTFYVPKEVHEPEFEFPNWNHKWGGGIYQGIFTQQNKNFYTTFEKLFAQEKIARVLEIGTASGGLTLALTDITFASGVEVRDAPIVTYDIKETKHADRLRNRGVDVRVMDAFEDLDRIFEYIQSDGQTLVLCDGGNKPAEFNLFSRILKTDDIIMAHDYVIDNEYYDVYVKDNIWRWCEIKYKDISIAVDKYGLSPYMADEFQEAAWACFKKTSQNYSKMA